MGNFITEKGNIFAKILIFFSTIKYLKVSQVYWQVINRLRVKKCVNKAVNNFNDYDLLKFNCFFSSKRSVFIDNKFMFLNQSHTFSEQIDWNFMGLGKLWNYNLEYFDYLHQEELSLDRKGQLISEFYDFSEREKRKLEPYPVSLRAINIIKYICKNGLDQTKSLNYLYQELSFLHTHYEFHILGNHLLENAFAMCCGGAFFKNTTWHDKAVSILFKELDEQILADGAHFELSPMYHSIVFFRLLEFIDWYGNYAHKNKNFYSFCREKASLMLDWFENIRFKNGDIPLFNDSAKGIAFDSSILVNYCERLGIQRKFVPLGESGYRSFEKTGYEVKVDFAQIGAMYQPGHAHADALGFILYYNDTPIFVEQGTSTYEIGERRRLERSTGAHNTIVINGRNQSEVWGGFRVGERAKTTIFIDSEDICEANHNGYARFGVFHSRKILFQTDCIKIVDKLSKRENAICYLHVHPERIISQTDKHSFLIDGKIKLSVSGAKYVDIEDYEYAESYNRYQIARRFVFSFEAELLTTIIFEV